jgi:phosphate transport system protein
VIFLIFRLWDKRANPVLPESRLFREDRERIMELLALMGEACLEALEKATSAVLERDPARGKAVVDGDDRIDGLEVEIEQACLSSIALHKPVRDDLRFIFSVMKIITDLERVGDQAVNIARRVIGMKGQSYLKPLEDLPQMAEISMGMLSDGLKAFRESDAGLAREVFRRDDKVDRLNRQISDELLRLMAHLGGEEKTLGGATDLILIARCYERVGDHACNIAERAYFMITGNRIKQSFPADPEGS